MIQPGKGRKSQQEIVRKGLIELRKNGVLQGNLPRIQCERDNKLLWIDQYEIQLPGFLPKGKWFVVWADGDLAESRSGRTPREAMYKALRKARAELKP